MSIIQKLLGGPDFFMEADEATLAKIKPADPKPVVAPEPVAAPEPVDPPVVPEPPKVEAVATPVGVAETAAPESDAEAIESVAVAETVVTESAPAKTTRKKTTRKKKKKVADVPAPAGTSVVAGGDDIQALVDSAIAQASAVAVEAEQQSASTFATDFLLTPTMKGRRKPGPSLTGFMDMAGTMKR